MIAEDDLPRLHEAALRLLAETGAVVRDADALAGLAAHGAAVDGQRVRIPDRLIAEALAAAPAGYTVAGRRRALDLTVNQQAPPVLASASGPAFILDQGRQRTGTLADLRQAIALTHLSPNIQLHGVCVEALDVPAERRTRVVLHAFVTGSDKAHEAWVGDGTDLEAAITVQEILYGAEWHALPRLWTFLNSTSPLQLSAEVSRAIRRLASLGQPVSLTPCAMGGTTGPITLAGLLALQHAETLLGLVLTELVRPGCPFLYGGTSSISSMRSGALLMGAPEYWSLTEATIRLGHWCGLPVRAGGALTDAHTPDAQASAESALSLMSTLGCGREAAAAQAQVVLHAAGILSSFNCYSPAKFVIDDELITALRTAAAPIVVDEENLALEALANAGPGGNLLSAPHTKHHARDHERSTLMQREPYETWRALGGRDLAAAAAQRAADLLATYAPPDDLDPIVRRQLDEYCLG